MRALVEKKREEIPLGASSDVSWVYANADESSLTVFPSLSVTEG